MLLFGEQSESACLKKKYKMKRKGNVMLVNSDSMLCLVTRVKVRKLTTLISIIFAFFRMRRKARSVPGLLESIILIQRQRTVIFLSLWQNSQAMAQFATAVPEHAFVVRQMYYAHAEVWSGAFTLQNESSTKNPWLQGVLQAVARTK